MEDKNDVEYLNAKEELEKLDDNQILNILFNMLEICKKDYKLMYKNILILSMEIAFNRGLIMEDCDPKILEQMKQQMIEITNDVI